MHCQQRLLKAEPDLRRSNSRLDVHRPLHSGKLLAVTIVSMQFCYIRSDKKISLFASRSHLALYSTYLNHHLAKMASTSRFGLKRQPTKALYLVYHLLSTILLRYPFWIITNLPRSARPHASWSLKKCVMFKLYKHMVAVNRAYVYI